MFTILVINIYGTTVNDDLDDPISLIGSGVSIQQQQQRQRQQRQADSRANWRNENDNNNKNINNNNNNNKKQGAGRYRGDDFYDMNINNNYYNNYNPNINNNNKNYYNINNRNEKNDIFELIIPKNDPTNACIKMNSSFHFSVTYQANAANGSTYMNTVNFTLTERDNFTFTGLCGRDKNMIELQFLMDWRLELYFYRIPETSETFLFNHVVLYYRLSGSDIFPGAVHAGAQSELYDSTFINSSISKSYRCISGVEIDLSEVKIYLRNLTLEPFFNKRPNLPFDPAEECPGDREAPVHNDTSTLWILIAIAVIIAITVISCTWFICYKIRSDYLAIRNDKDVIKVRV